jgi:hypothetical protein
MQRSPAGLRPQPVPLVGSEWKLLGLLPESQLIAEMDRSGRGCEDGRWMELAQDLSSGGLWC